MPWWIDAICIDQSNVAEKNMVVPQMGKIYLGSQCTIVWLGEADSQTSLAFSHMSRISASWEKRSDHLKMREVELLTDEHRTEYIDRLEEEFSATSAQQSWDAIDTIWERSWWRRSWIVQEVSLASGVVLMCGHHAIGWDHICNVVRVVLQHIICLRQIAHPLKTLVQEIVDHFMTTYQPFDNLDAVMRMYAAESQPDGLPDEHMLLLLAYIRQTKCKDPRDKIYSALGMLSNSLGIEVNYNLPTEEIYTNLACIHISQTQSLSIFSYCAANPGLINVPTWVPDWTAPRDRNPLGIPQRGIRGLGPIPSKPTYTMSLDLNLSVRFQANNRILAVRALPMFEIAFVSSEFSDTQLLYKGPDYQDELRGIREWASFQHDHSMAFEYIENNSWQYRPDGDMVQFKTPTYIPTNESLLGAYFRTLCANLIYDRQAKCEVELSVDGLTAPETSSDSLFVRMTGRKLAVSTDGVLILAPPTTEPGDVCTVVVGSEIPLILRKAGDNYKLVGQCYAHGFMGDELWKLVHVEDESQIGEICII